MKKLIYILVCASAIVLASCSQPSEVDTIQEYNDSIHNDSISTP